MIRVEFSEYHVIMKNKVVCPWHDNHYKQFKKISNRTVIFLGRMKLRLRKVYRVYDDLSDISFYTYRPPKIKQP
jgi:hypothetical protein